MERRSFIQNSIISVVGAAIYGSKEVNTEISSDDNGARYYMAESGVYGVDNSFVLGLLKVNNADLNEVNISRLRDVYRYRNVLRYCSNDKYKIPFVKAVIETFFDSNNFKLHLLQSDITSDIDSINRKLAYANERKTASLKRLLDSFESIEGVTGVISKFQSLNGPSSTYLRRFEVETGLGLNIQVTRDSNLLQMASFLTSTVSAIIKDNVNHPVKAELTEYFQDRIKDTSFTKSFSQERIVFIK